MNNFFIFNEGTRVSESEIYKLAQKIDGLVKNTAVLDKPIAYEVAVAPTELETRTPEKHGGWDGERKFCVAPRSGLYSTGKKQES